MPLTKEERARIQAEADKAAARAKESDEQKWLRGAIRDSVKEELAEILGLDDDDEGAKPRRSGGGSVSFLDKLLGSETG